MAKSAKAQVVIRGYRWAMTFRGFEMYLKNRSETRNEYIARPCFGIEAEEMSGTFESIADAIDAYWASQGR